MNANNRKSLGFLVAVVCALAAGCERPPVEPVQGGYRGLGMEQVYNPRTVAEEMALHQVPEPVPPVPSPGPPASAAYENVQVLGDLGVAEFTRLMQAMTEWVAPEEGCSYCHVEDNLASDDVYTKVVSRRMIQMTRDINRNWERHVADTGVTCWTCHRGQPVPRDIWFIDPGPRRAGGYTNDSASQNIAAEAAQSASLPYDPFTPFLLEGHEIRVQPQTALPEGHGQSIKQTEWTYSLMMHISGALGVNCTYCHNSRSFMPWDQSTPARAQAWHGIRLTRALNNEYLAPLDDVFPVHRLGPLGDAPKVNCATCHQGAYKPLYGESMLDDYPELGAGGESAATGQTTSMAE